MRVRYVSMETEDVSGLLSGGCLQEVNKKLKTVSQKNWLLLSG